MTKGFRGRLTELGAHDAGQPDSWRPPEEHLGCHVWLHGYIADRKQLSRRLGVNAGRITDRELLAHAFRKWGRQLQAHVLGEYAAVVFDSRSATALLAHDALGLVPLFYEERAGSLAFATNLLDIVHPTAAQAIDDEYVADFLACGYMTDERTPYRSIKRLLPGRSLWWEAGQTRHIINWDLGAITPIRCRSDEEYEEQFRAHLEAGVSAALDAAGITGISLSGGLDSSSVACVAALQTRDLAAYSVISPRWPEQDEQPWMRAVVEQSGIPWHALDLDTMLPFSTLPRIFHGEPTAASISEESARVESGLLESLGITVALSGEGGDCVLCASPGVVPTHLADPLFDWSPAAALAGMRAWRDRSPGKRSTAFWMLRAVAEPAARHLQGKLPISNAPLPPWIRADYSRETRLNKRMSRRITPRCRHPGRQTLCNALWFLSLSMAMLPKQHMTFEYRNPLLYLPLVEFMCAIPWEQKLRPECDRYLQRRALKGVLPETVRRRASKGSGNPAMVEGLRQSRDWIPYLCDSPMLADRGIVDAEQWRLAVRQASVGQTHDDRYFLAAVAVEVWLKQLAEFRADRFVRPQVS